MKSIVDLTLILEMLIPFLRIREERVRKTVRAFVADVADVADVVAGSVADVVAGMNVQLECVAD